MMFKLPALIFLRSIWLLSLNFSLPPAEKEVVWHKKRKLTKTDFQASPAEKPNLAETFCFIRYYTNKNPAAGKITFKVETVFDAEKSYFKADNKQGSTLQHEQGHFDLAEIYARKYLKAVQEQVEDGRELGQKNQVILQQYIAELQSVQEKYDADIHPDRNKQKAWLKQIDKELANLKAYEKKEIELPLIAKNE